VQSDFLNRGPLPCLDPDIVLEKDKNQTSWLSINTRALSEGYFHKLPDTVDSELNGADPTYKKRYEKVCHELLLQKMEVNEVKERWVASVATSTDLSAKVAELTTTLKEALIDLDPNHPKHGRWNKRVKNSQLTGDRREAFRKHHENLKPFHELAHSSQLKFLSLHVHPRMAELFILAGTGGFTAMLGLWIAKHTEDFHWEGSSGVVKSERYITSLVEMVAVVPKQFDALKGKMAPKIMRAAATSRQFIRLLDDSNMSRMSADRWRRWFKGKVKFPAKGPCLTARKDEAIARDELLGVAVRNETVITHADGSTITNEQFHLDLKRVDSTSGRHVARRSHGIVADGASAERIEKRGRGDHQAAQREDSFE